MREWKFFQQDESLVSYLCEALNCTHFFARVLINRGIDSYEKANDFLNTSEDCLFDPFLFQNMDSIVERIGKAVRDGERITVYGDYDVDGITATGLLLEVLQELGGNADYYIPSRFTEGYGVNSKAIQSIAAKGTTLLITVDTGITAVAEVSEAKMLGMDVIITDHHECQSVMPDTLILNPKCRDCDYPFKELAGVGVVFKLACALHQRYGCPSGMDRFISFAAIGTIADIMPMRGENRYIVRRGLEVLKNTDCPGLNSLLTRCVGERPIDTGAVGFVIAPRINAAGRMGSAEVGVELLVTRNPQYADQLVEELCKENNRRQATENEILEQAIKMIESDPESHDRPAIVLWHPDWHNGVIGIVASRLKERYGKPCVLFTVNGEMAKGSGRSVRPFNLFDALERMSPYLERFGGHAFAAGVLVKTDQLPAFREALCKEVRLFQENDQFDYSIQVECELKEMDLSVENVRQLDKLSPFGRGNETPVFCLRNAVIMEAVATANNNHMRLSLRCDKMRFTAFCFNVSPDRFCYCAGDAVDLVFEADVNTYNGRSSVRLLIKDLKLSESRTRSFQKDWERISCGDTSADDLPNRTELATIYRYFQKCCRNDQKVFDLLTLPVRIFDDSSVRISLSIIYHSLEILRELGVFQYARSGSVLSDFQIFSDRKVNIEDSELFKIIKSKGGDIE